jgi:hypothetical protein
MLEAEMPIALILQLVQMIPGILQTAQGIASTLSTNDLATLQAALVEARTAALADEAQAVIDLTDAAKS